MARHTNQIVFAPRLLPLIFIFLIFIYDIESCMTGLKSAGVTYPQGDIRIEYGQPLRIDCVLNDEFLEKNEYGEDAIKNITFKRNNQTLAEEMISVVNKSTVQLYIEKPPLSESMYYCIFKTTETVVCFNNVIVGTKPKEVEDFSCVSFNFNNMTCNWTAPENYVKTNYSLKYHFNGRNSRGYYNCPKIEPVNSNISDNRMKCFWDLSTEPLYRQSQKSYYFTLTAANEFGNMSIKYNFSHFANVIPEPPFNLSIVNKTTESILLRWSVPVSMRSFPPGLEHRVLYQNEFDKKTTWTTANTSMLPNKGHTYLFNLTGLPYSHALYDIRVSSRSCSAAEDDERMWSRFAPMTVRTVSKLPASPPRTNIGSFETVTQINHRDIIIYWQFIPEEMKNGENVTYQIISVLEKSTNISIVPNEVTNTYAKFNKLSLNSYTFTIATANEIGLSTNTSQIFVPAYNNKISEPGEFVKIALSDNSYELTWIAPKMNKNHEPIDNYTIFWCNNDRDRPYQCKGYLQWVQIPVNLTSYNVTVPGSEIYQFAISANTKHASSGMVWASCTVILHGGVGKMKNLWIDHVDATYMHITWKLGCSDHVAGIEGFKIYYCPITSPVELNCKEPEKSLIITDPTATEGKVTNLRPYTTYMLTVSVITKHNSNSLQSERLYNTTMEDIPDTPPQNVQISNITNSSITVEWLPPNRMNGVLRYYAITYGTKDNRDTTIKLEQEKNVPQMKPKITLENLNSYTYYTITIRACTVNCSAPSKSTIVRTAVSKPGRMHQPSINNPNISLIQISWMAPEDRGGDLNIYELRIKEKTNYENATRIVNTTDLKYTIPNCQEDETYRIYYFSVRAVNIDNNKRYVGPWSSETENYCQASPKYVYYLLLGIFLFLIMGIIVIYSTKWIWTRCMQMSDIDVKLPGNLEQHTEVGLTHWPVSNLSGKDSNSGLNPPDIDPDADEQLLLEQKADIVSGDSSGCSSGHESVISSLASGTNLSCGMDSGTEQPKTPNEAPGSTTDGSSSREGSLRLRKHGSTPGYCVLGVGTVPQTDTSRGYVPVPKPNFTTPPDIKRKPVSSPYVIAIDPKQLINPEKVGIVPVEIGYSSIVPTSTLINIDPGALPFGCQVSGCAGMNGDLATDYVKTDRGLQADPLASDYLLNSYCRLGLDGKTITPPKALASESDLMTNIGDNDSVQRLTVHTSDNVKGYVPHKHFDSKMLKGD